MKAFAATGAFNDGLRAEATRSSPVGFGRATATVVDGRARHR